MTRTPWRGRLALVAFSLLALAGCSEPGSEPRGLPEAELRDSLVDRLNDFSTAVTRGDLDEAATFYCDLPGPSVQWFEDGELRYPSRASLLENLGQAAQYGTIATTWSEVDALPLGRDRAWASMGFTTTIGEGESSFGFSGAMTILMVRTEVAGGSGVPATGGVNPWCALKGHTSSLRADSPR